MTIDYTVRFSDLWRFNAVHQLKSIPFQLLYMGLAALIAWSTAHGDSCSAKGDCIWVGCFTFVFVYVALVAFQFLFNAAFLFTRDNRNVLTSHRVELKTEGLYEETAYTKSLFLWPGIHKVVVAAGFVAIYVTAHSAILIPKRSFTSASAFRQFVDAVKAQLNRGVA
jgi:hypothetical protein